MYVLSAPDKMRRLEKESLKYLLHEWDLELYEEERKWHKNRKERIKVGKVKVDKEEVNWKSCEVFKIGV